MSWWGWPRAPASAPRAETGAGIRCRVEKSLTGADGPLQLHVDLDWGERDWLALMGPSGAGKTSLLRMLAGLSQPDRGRIEAFGECWFDHAQGFVWPVRRRRIGYVFQDYALFPNMRVRRTLRFAQPRGADPERVERLLREFGLAQLADAHPSALSGGQQQRLALARALASEPRLLLFDEPMAAQDAALRRDLQDMLCDVRAQYRPGLILVTHDASEAVRLADRVLTLSRGRLLDDGNGMFEAEQAGCRVYAEVRSIDPGTGVHVLHLEQDAATLKGPAHWRVGERVALRIEAAPGRPP